MKLMNNQSGPNNILPGPLPDSSLGLNNGTESNKQKEELLQSLHDLQLNSEESPLYDNSELRTVQAALNMETPGTNSNPADLPNLQPQAFLNLNDFNNLFPRNPFAFDAN